MKYFRYLMAAAFVIALGGCTSMDQYPEDSISPETYFGSEMELRQYTNAFYSLMPAMSTYLWYEQNSELVIKNLPSPELLGTRALPSKASEVGWTWTDLRDINYFLQYSHRCNDKEVRDHYDGVAYFFRAFFYYKMLVKFGEVPLYDEPVGSSDKAMLCKPRDSRDAVINHILEDCDRAYELLPKAHNATEVCAWTALALKSRAALFEGTFRKYHDGDPFNPDHLDWKNLLKICAEASKLLMDKGGYSLHTGGSLPYREMFYSPTADDKEYIWARIATESAGKMHNANDASLTRGISLSKRFVSLYLMTDGSRFTDKPNWKTMGYMDECKDRDPRMAQTVLCPGYKQKGSAALSFTNFTSTKGGYQFIKYVAEASQNAYDHCRSALPIFRLAEVYLNYAEALAELGSLTQTDLDNSINKLRKRVKMPDLKMTEANQNPDPFLMSEEWGYPNVTKSDNTGVILEIRRERLIELALENNHYEDILRWKEGKVYEKPFYGMYFPGPGKYDMTGDGRDNICLYEGKKPSGSGLKFFQIGKDIILSEGNHGFTIRNSEPGLERVWTESRDYLYGIPTNERILTGGVLTQNPGWDDKLTF
jgi:susD family